MTHTFMPLLLKSPTPRLMFVTSGTSALAETERSDNKAFQAINASPAAGWPKPPIPNPVIMYRSAKTGLNMVGPSQHPPLSTSPCGLDEQANAKGARRSCANGAAS